MTMPLPLAQPGRVARDLADAYVALESARPGPADQPPGLVVVLPPAWGNRYQSLLYGAAGLHRYATIGMVKPDMLSEISWPGPIVLHAHWFAGIFDGCHSEVDANEKFEKMCEQVLAFRERTGAKLLWTAHNVFPHGNLFPETFLKLRQWVFETFDAIHVMQDSHVPVLEDAFDRVAPPHFAVPHMTYDGSQPDCVSGPAARVHYGFDPETFIFSYFGSIQPYKSLERMLRAFDRIAADSDRPVGAIVGGVPSDSATVQRLLDGWGNRQDIRLEMRMIPDHEIQYLHRAADAMVLPYGETLNSGAAFMAASFHKPIIMPAGMAASALDGLGALSFDFDQTGTLEGAMRAVIEGARGDEDPEARARLHPHAVSTAFFEALDGMLRREAPLMLDDMLAKFKISA